MELQATSLLYSSELLRNKHTFPLYSRPFNPPCLTPKCSFRNKLNISRKNYNRHNPSSAASALFSEEHAAVQSGVKGKDSIKLTYLELNGWLWDVGGVMILVDPVLVGNLNFGIPWLYEATKRFLKTFQLSDLPEIDCLLITKGLDDHCHMKTLNPLSKMMPDLSVIASLNAESMLSPIFKNITYLAPGQSTEIEGKIGSKVKIKAIAGPHQGRPNWQHPESGYILTAPRGELSLYYEPHCEYDSEILKKEQSNIVITPVIKQLLLRKLTLIFGQEDAVQLAKLLKAKFIVPMNNGEVDSKGPLSSIIQGEGTVETFKALLSKEIPDAQVLEPTPGVPLEILA